MRLTAFRRVRTTRVGKNACTQTVFVPQQYAWRRVNAQTFRYADDDGGVRGL